jgi:glycosyltransferase involved in cell wall biosynthesis
VTRDSNLSPSRDAQRQLDGMADANEGRGLAGHRRATRSGDSRGIRVAAVIPALNEAEAIGTVVSGIRDVVDAVFVIDDGSADATAERAAAAGAVVLRHEQNAGKGHAVRTGLRRVMDESFTHVLLLDGDMQHLPQEAARLIQTAAESGADAVLGERVFFREQMPASRYHANRLGSRVLSWFVGVRLRDTQCGFRIFRVDALRPIRLSASGYEIETEMLVKITRRGGRVTSVPITAVYANERSKLRPVRDTTRTCFLAVYYRFLERV